MKKSTILFAVLALLLLLGGCRNAQPAPTESGPTETGVPTGPLDMTGTVTTPEAYLALCAEHPGREILWSVPMSAGPVRSDTRELTLPSLTEADLSLMTYLPNLEQVDLTGCEDYELILRLRSEYPDLDTVYSVRLGAQLYPSDHTGELVLTDPDAGELQLGLSCLPNVTSVTLTGQLPDTEALIELKEQFPGVTFFWEFDFLGVSVTSLTGYVDLSGTALSDTGALEALLPCFYRLETVDMCGCGLSNETMAGLNARYPDTEFVWEVQIGRLTARTDSVYFMPSKYGITWMRPEQTVNLKYLTNLIALDLGHYVGVNDVSFLKYMPNLKILSLNSGTFTDLSPIGTCQKLEFLELFLATGTDLWPLTNCVSLKNLNISYMPYCDPLPLHQMTWLDRLWVAGSELSSEEKAALREALPNTVMVFQSGSSTNKGWRNSPSYYEVRDLTGMNYMTR